jgi:hypothetical protein
MHFYNKEYILVEDNQKPLFTIEPDNTALYLKCFINNDLNNYIEYDFNEDEVKQIIKIFQYWLDNINKTEHVCVNVD